MVSESRAALQVHNMAREELSLPPLQWSCRLAWQAKTWAKELAKRGSLEHSDAGGENLYWSSTSKADFANAVHCWLEERSAYCGEEIGEGDFGQWGHFSQCVWHSTLRVGMGKATSAYGTFVVARYDPKGNVVGEKPYGN